MYGCLSTCWLYRNNGVWTLEARCPHTCGTSGGCRTELPYELGCRAERNEAGETPLERGVHQRRGIVALAVPQRYRCVKLCHKSQALPLTYALSIQRSCALVLASNRLTHMRAT